MPELPEVETIRRDLSKKIVGVEIKSVELIDKNIGEAKNFANVLVGSNIVTADRIGKLLILHLENKKYLLIHLKMTGQLVYKDQMEIVAGGHPFKKQSAILEEVGGELPNAYTRFVLTFIDGKKLFFNDMRRFGYVKIVDENELLVIKEKFGIEPLQPAFTLENFKKALTGKRIAIKTALLDQKNIAGIGNIYASEILYAARVMPNRPTNSLTAPELKEIFEKTELIIKTAIKHRGTTFSDYVDTNGEKGNFSKLLAVYERANKSCNSCAGTVKIAKINGRSTYFCPKCQK